MIRFALELRVDPNEVNIDQRVDDVITIMNLHRCKNKAIPEFPPTRGDAGCEMRRLSIALEIVHLPPLIVLDEPTLDFDPAISVKIMACLKTLTKRGHIVICSMAKPSSMEFALLDRVVLLTEGHTIFSGPPGAIERHFCSADMGYVRKKGVELVDFVLDISSGIERPDTMRVAELPSIMQEKFEASNLFVTPAAANVVEDCHAFNPEFFKGLGYLSHIPPFRVQLRRFFVTLRRAITTKLKDFTSLRALFMASFVLSSVIGYLQYGQGNYGNYCLSIIGVPFKNTTNVGSLIFFVSLFTQCFFFVDAHAHCQKLQLFRYEQVSGCMNALSFFMAMVISEVPFAMFFGFIFGNILFNMAQLYGPTASDYGYFISVTIMASLVGLSTTVMYCALFKKELAVRDMFFLSLAIVILLSGFPFTQPNMPEYMVSFSQIIPTR
jgi:energy-coupling factor transporter ATP-binding protein EcfA2